MSAVGLIKQGVTQMELDLLLGDQVVFKKEGGKLFCELAVEAGLIYSRVLLNFLGIYCKQRKPVLESRAPRPHFHESEVWIEKFPGGRLLPVSDFVSIRAYGVSKQKMYWHVVRSLRLSNTETAHLTDAVLGKLRPGQLRLDSIYYTCWLARKQIMVRFYQEALHLPVPVLIKSFDNDKSSCVPEA